MKLGISIWENRVAPLFDVSSRLVLFKYDDQHHLKCQRLKFGAETLNQKLEFFRHIGLTHIICGGITQKMYQCLTARGITVIPFVCGDSKSVVRNFYTGRAIAVFNAMPGGNKLP